MYSRPGGIRTDDDALLFLIEFCRDDGSWCSSRVLMSIKSAISFFYIDIAILMNHNELREGVPHARAPVVLNRLQAGG